MFLVSSTSDKAAPSYSQEDAEELIRIIFVWMLNCEQERIFSTNMHNVPPSYNGFLFPCKGKAINVQTSTGLSGSKRFRLPDFKTIDT
jgi:hypothetical protein